MARTLLVAFWVAAFPAVACDSEPAPSHSELVPPSSMGIKTPLLVFDKWGHLLKYDLASSQWTIISNIDLDLDRFEFAQSSDGRWLSYGGALKQQQDVTQLWLFDIRSGSNRLYYSQPTVNGFDAGAGVLSPNGNSLAVYFDPKGMPDAGRAGVYLIDSVTLKHSFLGNPWSEKSTQKRIWGGVQWSKDGRQLLIELREETPKDGVRFASYFDHGEYFSYDLKRRRFERKGAKWGRNGSPTAINKGFVRFWDSGRFQSPDGRLTMNLSKGHVLTVKSKGGQVTKITSGGYDHCTGASLLTRGWLDNRHLVYSRKSSSLEGKDYVFDIHTGNTAELKVVLPGTGAAPYYYTW